MFATPLQSIPPEAGREKLSSLHVLALDGVRGLAVLMVILYHCSDRIHGSGLVSKIVRAPWRIGWSGVDLFFVLSGFLITGILLDTRDSANYFRSFYARRALRIFPLYYFVLTTILITAHMTTRLDYMLPIQHDRIFYFFYLNNWWPLLRDTWHGNIIGHFWSLAVEEQFYLLWSLCVFVVRPKHICKVAVGGVVCAFLIRWAIYAHAPTSRDAIENTFARMDALLAGAALAWLVRHPDVLERLKSTLYVIGAASAALFLWLYVQKDSGIVTVLGFSLLAFAYGALILFSFANDGANSHIQRLLTYGGLTSVGKYSYGMYVYHVPMLAFLGFAAKRIVNFEQSLWLTGIFMLTVVAASFVTAKVSFDLSKAASCSLRSTSERDMNRAFAVLCTVS